MSLTFLTRLLAFLVLLAIAAVGGWFYGPTLGRYIAEAQSSTTIDADIDSRAIIYQLSKDRPLTFIFSQPVELVRVLAQTSVDESVRADEEGFTYSIEARMFDAAGVLVEDHLIHLHSDAPDIVFASGETWRFFRNNPNFVAGMDDVLIEAPSPIVRTEWRLVEADQNVRSVDIRVYERRPLLASQARAAFNRRSDDEQSDFALGNAFPPDMLTDDEIANISINQWRPVGPAGIAGRDYQARVLYEGSRRDRPGGAGR